MSSTIRLFLLLLCALTATSCVDTRHRLVVSVAQQRMVLFEQDKGDPKARPVRIFAVSTSKFGTGSAPASNYTPLGKHEIAKKIGGGQPLGMKFKSRVPTGEIVAPNSPGRDPIVTRIMWLRGLESRNANTYQRLVYIHGTPEESRLGTRASYGCIRMGSRDIMWLYDKLGNKVRVDIVPGPLPPPTQLPL